MVPTKAVKITRQMKPIHMNLSMNLKFDNYITYSEFKNSDWYIYWDTEFSRIKQYQLMVVWHIKAENYVYYDYVKLKELLSTNTAQNGLPYLSLLEPNSIEYFLRICHEFIADVDIRFGGK